MRYRAELIVSALLCIVLTLGVGPGTAIGETVISTFGPNDSYKTSVVMTVEMGVFLWDNYDIDVAVPFVVAGNNFMLKSIELAVRDVVPGPNGLYVVLLGNRHDGALDRPDLSQVLEVFLFDPSSIPDAGGIIKGQSATRPILQAGSKYWVYATMKCRSEYGPFPGYGPLACNPAEVFWFYNPVEIIGDLVRYSNGDWQFFSGFPTPALRVAGVPDTVPWAYAGPDQFAYLTDIVHLDGTASTLGSGTAISFSWTFDSKPVGSVAAFDDPTGAMPSFDPDLPGMYVVKLIVNDGYSDSDPDTAIITVENTPPVAAAGSDQTAKMGTIVNLDGSGSYDTDGDYPLSYTWSFLFKPTGSTAVLNGANTATPSFTKDMLGYYDVKLIVTDSKGNASAPDVIRISTYYTSPVADAGPDQAISIVGSVVQLDGTKSYDLDEDAFTFEWSINRRPTGSVAQLSDPSSPTPTFIADVRGEYVISLIVYDQFGGSYDTVTVSFANVPPVANAGGNQSVPVMERVLLDGSGSYDADGDALKYYWSLVKTPIGSRAELQKGGAPAQVTFVADVIGTYVVNLSVNDGIEMSKPDSATILAVTIKDAAAATVMDVTQVVNKVDPANFMNRNLANALTSKLNAALEMIDQGRYQDALNKLEHDILGKADGCAATGSPDRNDWIMDCADQNQIYPLIIEAIELLRSLV